MPGPVEVHVSLPGGTFRVGTLHRTPSRDRETVSFEYHETWLEHEERFALEPALAVGRGRFYPNQEREMFGAIGDSAPDTWGRQLMRRRERRRAEAEGRAIRTLHETDFLLGVADVSRLGALRLRYEIDEAFQALTGAGVPGFIMLGRLLDSAQRIERGEETDEDLQLIFAPGSSLGGARPKASVEDTQGRLAIAKFPKESDEYCVEAWEHIALTLAQLAGIRCPDHDITHVGHRPVLLSWRFDREGGARIPFLSALSMLQLKDGDRSSYPEIMDELTRMGAGAKSDSIELFRRMVFNILISNVDDHLRNHGFLFQGKAGWVLSPAYDLNPTPQDIKPRVLTTLISPEDGTCSVDLAIEQAPYFGLKRDQAAAIVVEVGAAVSQWRNVAQCVGQTKAQMDRMESAFEHPDLERAKAMASRST